MPETCATQDIDEEHLHGRTISRAARSMVALEQRPTRPVHANPQHDNITASLAAKRLEVWNLRQHASNVNVDDRVLVWNSGLEAAKITSEACSRS
ncbi:hypothetical protein GCM10008957_35460 [Deinococcus ruber]|uniref:Uncharacterized protein n=1 Tax=Deinococcus ruber TaxID=1848197 RepID=A0A918CEA2_9DEIO|nr:hypothetical protein GCM10008957_35460 [Deinococcus ruber]